MISGSSGLPWARAAAKAGLISRRQMAKWGVDAIRFRMRGATDEATERLLGEVKAVFHGTSAREIARMAPEVLVGVLPRIYPEMLEEVYVHQDAGRPTFIVSAAGDELVQLLARILYMDGGIGTSYEVDETGPVHRRARRRRSCTARARSQAMRALRRRARHRPRALLRLLGLGSDLPMLRAVGIPVVVNPDERAHRDRRRRGLAGDALRAPRPPPRARGAERRVACRRTARTA